MRKLLSIPTSVRTLVSLEERREAAPAPTDDKNPDVIDLTTVAEEVVDGGVGATVPGAEPEGGDAPSAEISPEAPASAEEAPEVALATDASVAEPAADPVVEPVADVGATPPAAGEEPGVEPVVEPEADVSEPAPAEAPAVGEEPVTSEPAVEPAPEEVPVTEPAVEEPPVEAPVEEPIAEPVVEEPAAEPAVEEPASDVPPAEEPVTDVPSDAAPFEEPGAEVAPVDGEQPSDLGTDEPPVTGEAPAEPPIDGLGTDVPAAEEPAVGSDDPLSDGGAAVEGEPVVEPIAEEAPVAEEPIEETTSAWVDGVSVDAEDIKQDIQVAAEEVVESDEDVEELTEAGVALEAIRDALVINTADEDPIISETTVNLTRVEVNKVLERVTDTCDIPSLESAGSRNQLYTLTLESIGEKIKEIWEAVKKALIAAWNALVGFLKNIFDGATRLKNQVTQLLSAVKGMKAGEAKVQTIENPSLYSDIAAAGETSITPSNTQKSMAKLATVSSNYLGNINDSVHKVIASIGSDFIEAMEVRDATSEHIKFEAVGKIVAGYGAICGKLVENIADGVKKTGYLITSGSLPGSFHVGTLVLPRDLQIIDKASRDVLNDIARGNALSVKRQDAVKGQDLPVLSPAEMQALLEEVEIIVDAVLASKASVDKFEDDIAIVRKKGDDVISTSDGDFGDKLVDFQLFRVVVGMGPTLVKTNARFSSMLVTIGANVCKYVAASGKQYDEFGSVVEGSTVASAGAKALPAPVAA